MSIQSLVVGMKSERCQFLKVFFENQASSVKDLTHAIQFSPLIVLYFKTEIDPL